MLLVASSAALLFALTDLDDLIILLAFFADPTYRTRQVVMGQFLGIGAIFLASVLASLVALVIPRGFVGLLGLIPMALGAMSLVRLGRGEEGETGLGLEPRGKPGGRIAAVAVTTAANGGDNVATYAPFFATHSAAEVAVFGLVVAAMTGLWCVLAKTTLRSGRLLPALTGLGSFALPFVLIGLGISILYRGGSLALLGAG